MGGENFINENLNGKYLNWDEKIKGHDNEPRRLFQSFKEFLIEVNMFEW